MKTHDWARAEEIRKDWERRGAKPAPEPEPVEPTQTTVDHAVKKFIEDCEARNLNRSTFGKYKRLATRLQDFAALRDLRDLPELTVEQMRDFRGTWKGSLSTLSKDLERLRQFFKLAVESDWIPKNPAR